MRFYPISTTKCGNKIINYMFHLVSGEIIQYPKTDEDFTVDKTIVFSLHFSYAVY